MRVVPLVTRIVKACESAGRRMLRSAQRAESVSTTVAVWLRSAGWGDDAIRQWSSAVGRAVAKVARSAGFNPPKVWVDSPWAEYVYPDATFMDIAWNTPDKKGRTYADKVGATHTTNG